MNNPFNTPSSQAKKPINVKALVLVGILLIAILLGVGLVMRSGSLSPQKRATTATAPVCVPEYASCEWKPGIKLASEVPDAPDYIYDGEKFLDGDGVEKYRFTNLTYKYTIFNVTENKIDSSGTTQKTSVTFVPKLGHQYRCEVTATNGCGDGGKTSTSGVCGTLSCGSACTTDAQCPQAQPHTCNAGKCVLSQCMQPGVNCTANKCEVIVPTTIPTKVPTAIPTVDPVCGGSCTPDGKCPTDHSCLNNKCILTACVDGTKACSSDKCKVISPTATPTLTNTPTPTANPVCGGSCQSQAQCPNDHSCVNGTCVLTTCLNGNPCTSNKCQKLDPTATTVPSPLPTSVIIVNNQQSQNQSQTQQQPQVQTQVVTQTNTVVITSPPQQNTTTVIVQATGAPQAQPQVQQPTAVPTIPSAGTPAGVYFMIVSSVVLASLLLIF